MLTTVFAVYRNAFSGLSRSTWLLTLVMLINRSGTMVVPFMTLYLTSPARGYSIGQAGFVFGLFGLGAFTGAYFGGKFTDKIGFYPVQIITLAGGGFLFFVLGQMNSYLTICLFTYALSFVNEAFRPANSTAIVFYSKEENRTRSYSLNRLAINIGWAVGSGLGGLLIKINYEIIFWVDGATNIIAALLIWLYLKPVNHQTEQKVLASKPASLSAYKDKTYILFIILTVLFASCFFQLFTNLPVFFKTEMHFSEPLIGILMAINGLFIAGTEMALIYQLEGRRKNLEYISAGVFLVGLSFLILTIPGIGVPGALLMILAVTIGEILAMPFMNSFWIGRTRMENRGQYAALYTMAWSAAQTLGPMAGSQVAQHLGFRWLWVSIGAISLLVSLLFNRLSKYHH